MVRCEADGGTLAIGPHTMLSCFLPALVFESAFSLEWHTFRRCAAQVLWLAGPGVLVGTTLMGREGGTDLSIADQKLRALERHTRLKPPVLIHFF